MKQRLIQQVGRSARLRVMNELKRTQGLCVADIAARVGMSYMGVKGICLDLEKRGLLDTWRHPAKIGRPQLFYRADAGQHEQLRRVVCAAAQDDFALRVYLAPFPAAEQLDTDGAR